MTVDNLLAFALGMIIGMMFCLMIIRLTDDF